MTTGKGQRWNLVFRGQLLPGTDEERARRTLAAFFGLGDSSGVAVFFSGRPVALRRNLSREEAERLYRQLRELGLICELADAAPAKAGAVAEKPAPPGGAERDAEPVGAGVEAKLRDARPGRVRDPGADKRPATRAQTGPAGSQGTTPARRSPRGAAPNLFSLRPVFDNRPGKKLQEQAQIRAMIAAVCAVGLVIVVLTVALRFPAAPAGKEPIGPLAAGTLAGNELVLMLENALLIHERSGLPRARVSAAELGLARFAAPLMGDRDGTLLLNGAMEDGPLHMQRCNLDLLRCEPAIAPEASPAVLALSQSFSAEQYFLLRADGSLQRRARDGELDAMATVQLPWGEPRLIASEGLLLLPAGDGPLLGIYRPDIADFGRQLDALLLMPPAAVSAAQDRIRDIAVTDVARWALLDGEDTQAGLYRFDLSWGDARPITLPQALVEPYLLPWRDKLLVADRGQPQLQRLSAEGRVEAPLESPLLLAEREDWRRLQQQRSLARSLGLILPLVLAGLCALAALIFYTMFTAAGQLPAQRSALLDPMPAGILWLPAAANREAALRRLGMILIAGPVLLALLAVLLIDQRSALALLPLAAAGGYARHALRRGSGGHLGLVGDRFIAVDYDGRYFYGELVLLRGSSRVLLARGLALPIGVPGLPNIDRAAFDEQISVSRKSAPPEVFGALWMARHPWLHAAVALCAGALLSIAGLLL